jgi:hypothetical protein
MLYPDTLRDRHAISNRKRVRSKRNRLMSVIASRPPPPPLEGTAFSTTVTEALFERLLMLDVHATVNFKLKVDPAGA